jgi:hypothetical protein
VYIYITIYAKLILAFRTLVSACRAGRGTVCGLLHRMGSRRGPGWLCGWWEYDCTSIAVRWHTFNSAK